MQKITPFLCFVDQAEEAMNFYASVFPNAKVTSMGRMPDGKVFTGSFQIDGQDFMALNGGPSFQFSEAISLFVSCDTQEEVDTLWEKLSEGGGLESRCGWVKDRFGISWQIIPKALGQLMGDPDPEKSSRVMKAMLGMNKIIIADLQKAYDGE